MLHWTHLFHAIFVTVLASNDAIDLLSQTQNSYNEISKRQGRFINDFSYEVPPTADEETFDFIVVGSGSAGSVIANRLSEVSKWKVLLLEVGEAPSFLTEVPSLAPLLQFTKYNWNYLMEKQENMCLGLIDQRMAWPRGRALGGTTIINYMIHTRGNRYDYDRWSELGNPGWSYDEILPYFLKSEDAHIKISDPEYHSSGGYLSVEDVRHRTGSVDAFVQGAQEAGHKYVDYNGERQLGVSYVQATTRRGFRCSTEKAFLRTARHRTNLKILTQARVVKILINPVTKVAYGVKYVKDRQYRKALASKEVVLSAGTFNSPQLLMLSGVGPKEHLEELNVTVLRDLPVGQKMYDHLCFLGLSFSINASIVSSQSALINPVSMVRWLLNGEGPLTDLAGVEGLLYHKTNISNDPRPYPDIEYLFTSGTFATDKGDNYRKTFRITDEVYNAGWQSYENTPLWTPIPMLVHPKSYGYLKLKSKNPYHWPLLYGNYLTDPEGTDVKTFIAAIREMQRVIQTPALQKIGTQLVLHRIPGCKHSKLDSDEYWECMLRHVSATLHHQVGTCKMGPRDDPESVVDNKLRVYGIKNLRVADCSIIPLPPTAHTNVPAIMVGEKAADLIKEDWTEGSEHKIDIRRHV